MVWLQRHQHATTRSEKRQRTLAEQLSVSEMLVMHITMCGEVLLAWSEARRLEAAEPRPPLGGDWYGFNGLCKSV